MVETTTVAVHRCRFVDFAPSAISALAFPPLPLPSVKGKKSTAERNLVKFGTLAIGHGNGNIDLCEWTGPEHQSQSPQAWVVRKTLSGPFPSKIDSLAFAIRHPADLDPDDVPSCNDLRLFSSGGGSDLVEWDPKRGCVRRTIGSQGGSIWSIAVNPASSSIALGCEDGSVRLISLLHDTFIHHRRFDRVKCRLLSIAWGPPVPRQTSKQTPHDDDDDEDDDDGDDDDGWTDSWLVTGGSDSSLRKWDVATGRVLDRMGTDKMRGERTLVWAVGVLGDGTIVSGDSLGMVKFWDSRTCTQLQSFQGHGADILCMTVGSDGTAVYTSGVDQRISQFSLVKAACTGNPPSAHLRSSRRWVQASSRRMHSHDVRALATWPPYTPVPASHKRQFPINISPVLASGGLDMSVILTPAALPTSTTIKVTNPLCTSADSTFEVSYHRRLAYTYGPSSTLAVRVARQARLLTCMRDTSITVWKIHPKHGALDEPCLANEDQEITAGARWEKVLDMELNVHTNLVASAISDDGHWLVASDLYESKLFKLESTNDGKIKPRRIKDFPLILQAQLSGSLTSTGGSAFSFTPDSSKLVMSTPMSAYVIIIDLGNDNQKPTILRRFDHHCRRNVIGDRVVKNHKIGDDVEMGDDEEQVSAAVNVLRLAVSADGQWLASSDDHARTHIFNLDSVQHHCTLPSFPLPAHALSFDPSHPNVLILCFPDDSLQIFDVEARQFPAWSKHLSHLLPKQLTHAHDPILGVVFDPAALNVSSSTMGASQALFWSSTWMCSVKLDDTPLASQFTKKRRRESKKHAAAAPPIAPSSVTPTETVDISLGEQPRDFNLITHFRPMLCVDFLGPGELVVVERPLVDVLATLPPAYFKHKYGS